MEWNENETQVLSSVNQISRIVSGHGAWPRVRDFRRVLRVSSHGNRLRYGPFSTVVLVDAHRRALAFFCSRRHG